MKPVPDRDALLEEIAQAICQNGLRTPFLVALEAGRPFVFLGEQLLWLAQPAMSLFWPSLPVRQLAELLEEPTTTAALAARLARIQD